MRKKIETIAVEIPVNTVRRLLSANQLCAAELTCLDSRSKKEMWRLCLETCMGLKCPMIWSQSDKPVCPGRVLSATQADPKSVPARGLT